MFNDDYDTKPILECHFSEFGLVSSDLMSGALTNAYAVSTYAAANQMILGMD